ncbi:MAG: 30S ribosomal protein S12 methylthiotransferase RimO [Firmicutes bacterium]|nr:30S ribosomal protein S12 methylthiotransferase RimO [Bacillota bacterium]
MSAVRIGLVSLGCAKNLVDSEVMLGMLKEAGFEIVPEGEEADIAIVNTCGFILPAKEESIGETLKLAELKNAGKLKALIMTGCLPQRYADELAKEMPEVDAFLGPDQIPAIVRVIREILEQGRVEKPIQIPEPRYIYGHETPRLLLTPPYTAYIKIAEGCDNRCSYCVIPSIRGRFRSRAIESIVMEAQRLVSNGVKELVLVAQDTTRYGEDLYGRWALAELLRDLASINGVEWVRFLYTYPTRITDELISVVASEPKVCKYFDVPLQHADDGILRLMGRRNTCRDARELIQRLREQIPGVCIRSTFIVGFPGEIKEAFDNLLHFLEDMRLDRVGIFVYSEEEGSPAENLPGKVPQDVAEDRYHQAMLLQQRISRERLRERIGEVTRVLIEGLSEESELVSRGRSQKEAPEIDGSIFIGDATLAPGTFRTVKIIDSSDYDLIGEVID